MVRESEVHVEQHLRHCRIHRTPKDKGTPYTDGGAPENRPTEAYSVHLLTGVGSDGRGGEHTSLA